MFLYRIGQNVSIIHNLYPSYTDHVVIARGKIVERFYETGKNHYKVKSFERNFKGESVFFLRPENLIRAEKTGNSISIQKFLGKNNAKI